MQQLELADHIQNINPNNTRFYAQSDQRKLSSDVFADLSKRFLKIAEALEACSFDKQYDWKAYAPIWISVTRESLDALVGLYPEDSLEDLEEYVKASHPVETEWLQLHILKRSTPDSADEYILSLFPKELEIGFREGSFITYARYEESDESLLTVISWLLENAEHQLGQLMEDPQKFNEKVEQQIPLRERIATIRRSDLRALSPELDCWITGKLTTEECREFSEVAEFLGQPKIISPLTPNSFFELCKIAYEASGHAIPGTPLQNYKALADNRHDGLLDLPGDSEDEFAVWLKSGLKGGHPWEILRGGNTTHISLAPYIDSEGWHLVLMGSAESRSAETIKIALALHKQGVSLTLADALKHKHRVDGTDSLKVLPQAYFLRPTPNTYQRAQGPVFDSRYFNDLPEIAHQLLCQEPLPCLKLAHPS